VNLSIKIDGWLVLSIPSLSLSFLLSVIPHSEENQPLRSSPRERKAKSERKTASRLGYLILPMSHLPASNRDRGCPPIGATKQKCPTWRLIGARRPPSLPPPGEPWRAWRGSPPTWSTWPTPVTFGRCARGSGRVGSKHL